MQKSNLTYERFISEASTNIIFGKTLRGILVFSTKESWESFNNYIRKFNETRRRWVANLIDTDQDDFFIIQFEDIRKRGKTKYFFLKLFPDKNHTCFVIYSYEGFHNFLKIKSLIKKTPHMWLGWIGSRFLERFDEFIVENTPNFKASLIKYITETHSLDKVKKKGSTIHYEPRNREDLLKIRKFHFSDFNELIYIKMAKFRIINEKSNFEVTLTDRTEFTIKSGGLYEFLDFYIEIMKHAQKLKDSFQRKIIINSEKRFLKRREKPIEIINIDKIESITVNMNQPTFPTWYDNLVNTFSLGFLKEPKILSFVLERGNPYFLAEIIDLEEDSRIFLSAIENDIRISPSTQEMKPSTVSKIFSILQNQVDPSIDISVL